MFGLKENVISRISEVLKKYPMIEQAVIYGSRAKGNYTHGSDIDLTLKGDGLNLEYIGKLESDLDELMLPYKFDISIYNGIENRALLDHINRVGKRFYTRDKAF